MKNSGTRKGEVFHVKRTFVCLLTLLLLLTWTTPAFADVMWEPIDNPFYENHRDQCEYENRAYYANGKDGFITLWDAPKGSMVRAQYENGEVLFVGYTYQNWSMVSRWEKQKEISGWVSTADLTLVYDYLCFAEEYADRITPYNGEFADYDGDIETINFYEYPGARLVNSSPKAVLLLKYLTGSADGVSYISSIFVDEDGRTWGFVNYLHGRLNSWFCLDEPDGTDFPVRETGLPELTPARTPVLPAAGYTPYVLVFAVAAATLALLAVFYGKKRKKPTV